MSAASPSAAPTSPTVGSASAAATDATSSASALSPSRRSRRSSSRLAGMGNRSVGAEAKPRRSSASASSSAKKALPPDVSQSRTSVGRGSPRPRRARSSSCIAPMLRPLDRERRQPVGRVRSNEPARHLATDGEQRGDGLLVEPCEGEPDGTERGGIEPLEVVDRETERVARSEGSQRREERSRDGSFVGLPCPCRRAAARSRAPGAGPAPGTGAPRRRRLRGDRPVRRTRGSSPTRPACSRARGTRLRSRARRRRATPRSSRSPPRRGARPSPGSRSG